MTARITRIVRTNIDPDHTQTWGRGRRGCMSDTRATCGAAGAGMLMEEEVVQSEGAKSNLAYTNHMNHMNRTNRTDQHGHTRTDHDDRRVTPYQKRPDPVHHRGCID